MWRVYGIFESCCSGNQLVGPVESFQPLSPLPMFYDTIYGFHADQLLWWDVVCGPLAPKVRGPAHIFKVTVVVDMLQNFVLWLLAPPLMY